MKEKGKLRIIVFFVIVAIIVISTVYVCVKIINNQNLANDINNKNVDSEVDNQSSNNDTNNQVLEGIIKTNSSNGIEIKSADEKIKIIFTKEVFLNEFSFYNKSGIKVNTEYTIDAIDASSIKDLCVANYGSDVNLGAVVFLLKTGEVKYLKISKGLETGKFELASVEVTDVVGFENTRQELYAIKSSGEKTVISGLAYGGMSF